MVSSIGQFVPLSSYASRIALNFTALLALGSLQKEITLAIKVSHIVSIHIWMMACQLVVICQLVQIIIALALSSQVKKESVSHSEKFESSNK